MAEAFCGGEIHGYLTFRSNGQAVAACALVIGALGTVAPQQGCCRRLSALFMMMSYVAWRCIHGMTPRRRNGERGCPPRWAPRAQIGPPSRRQMSGASQPTSLAIAAPGAYTGEATHSRADRSLCRPLGRVLPPPPPP